MVKAFPFAKRRVEEIEPPTSGRDQYRDTKTPGLVLRVTPNGVKSFGVYKKAGGRPFRYALGTFPQMTVEQARDEAKKVLYRLNSGENPAAIRRAVREAPTLKDLFEHWLEHARQRKKTWQDDERIFNKYFGRLRTCRLADIDEADVSQWHTKLGKEHGPYQANRARALLSAIWGKAKELGHLGPNPCTGVKRFREQSRERFLRTEEMRPFFSAVAGEPPTWRDFWLTCLFTGARRGNVAAMAWKDIDLAAGVWYLPGQKTKNGLPVAIVLPPQAVAILRTRRAGQPKAEVWVFPADTDTGHIVDPRKSWARILKTSGIENLRPHDLRRSLGSWQTIAGASLQIVGASLGHRDPKATAVYARLQLDPVRTSVNSAVDSMVKAGNYLGLEEGGEDDA
jgi:integrase